MSSDYQKQTINSLKMWGILAPVIMIASCAIIAAQEDFEARWNDGTIPVIAGLALLIFVVLRTVAYMLEWLTQRIEPSDDV